MPGSDTKLIRVRTPHASDWSGHWSVDVFGGGRVELFVTPLTGGKFEVHGREQVDVTTDPHADAFTVTEVAPAGAALPAYKADWWPEDISKLHLPDLDVITPPAPKGTAKDPLVSVTVPRVEPEIRESVFSADTLRVRTDIDLQVYEERLIETNAVQAHLLRYRRHAPNGFAFTDVLLRHPIHDPRRP